VIRILVERVVDPRIMRRACDMTRKPGAKPSTMSLRNIYRCEHSPIRTIIFWIEIHGLPTATSVHLVRHKFGVEHFVESNRDDRGGPGDDRVDRNTPVNHGLFVNAQELIFISRRRLCYHSHPKTVGVWARVKRAIRAVDPDLADFMVPECVYRNGICPEMRECKPGLAKVMKAYGRAST
jgi:hypothetical protein